MLIRPVNAADLEALAAVARRSWLAAFGAGMPPDEAEAYVAETRSAAVLQAALAQDVILVAEEGGAIRGYAQVGPVSTADVDFAPSDRELRALYVDPPHQDRGIGGQLLVAALALPELQAAERVFLDVWIKNAGARWLYERHGFVAIGERRFTLPSGEPGDPDLIMVRRRPSPGAGEGRAGTGR